MHLDICAFTAVGTRENNEDFLDYATLSDSSGIFVVADGMGGHYGGEVASKLAVETILGHPRSDDPSWVLQAVEAAHRKVQEKAQADHQLAAMGTTVVLLLVQGEKAYWTNLGDSRLYHLRNHVFQSRTKDDTLVEILTATGDIKEENMAKHPDRSKLLRFVGMRSHLSKLPWNDGIPLAVGDRFIVCSDGVWENLQKSEIEDLSRENETSSKLVNAIKNRVLVENNEKQDNYSMIVVTVLDKPPVEVAKVVAGNATPGTAETPLGSVTIKKGGSSRGSGWGFWMTICLLLLLLIGVMVVYFVEFGPEQTASTAAVGDGTGGDSMDLTYSKTDPGPCQQKNPWSCMKQANRLYKKGEYIKALPLAYSAPSAYSSIRNVFFMAAGVDDTWGTRDDFSCPAEPIACDQWDFFHLDRNTARAGEAKENLSKRCDAGIGKACHYLGLALLKTDTAAAQKPLKKAYSLGDLSGMGTYGYYLRKFTDKKERGMKILNKACAKGNMMACEDYGYAIQGTLGFEKAQTFLAKACKGGVLQGCFWLAKGSNDPAIKKKYYQKSCQGGLVSGCNDYALIVGEQTSDWTEASKWLSMACNLKEPVACDNLGYIAKTYLSDPGKAKKAFTDACNLGKTESCQSLLNLPK